MDLPEVLHRLVKATNAHDVDTLVDCFAPDYRNETPAHPERGFRGHDQVRRNWIAIFAAVPDITAQVLATAVDWNSIWTEWEMSGTRRDGTPHRMVGVIVFGIDGGRIVSARFNFEPVDTTSGDVNAAVEALTS